MHTPIVTPVALTITGSDSGGASGLQADLKTFSALGVYGTTAVTCITAQHPGLLSSVQPVEPRAIKEQIRKICDAFPVAAAKSGMLYSSEIARAVAEADVECGIPLLVVDPVMAAAPGSRLLMADAVETLCAVLLPAARVVTPNLREAETILGRSISNADELRAAAREIGEKYDVACVAMGGQLEGPSITDVLFDEGEEQVFSGPRIGAGRIQGCGSAFSAALTAYLARGRLLPDAVHAAKDYVAGAIEHALRIGSHRLLHHFWNASLSGPF